MTRFARIARATALSMSAAQVMAQSGPQLDRALGARGGFLAQVDADFGGDAIAVVEYEYGDYEGEQDVRAGQGLAFSVGGYFRPIEDSTFEIQASVGYKFVTTALADVDVHVTRTMLQLGAFHRARNGFYVGASLVNHIDPKLNGDGYFENVNFDDATGFGAEIGWRWIGLHYTNIEYSSRFYEDVDASNIGLRFTYRFGQRWF
jgi:hypothetical protein